MAGFTEADREFSKRYHVNTNRGNTTKKITCKFTTKCRVCGHKIWVRNKAYWTPGEKGVICQICHGKVK